jgi:sugar transferase (PEP-CTERM/EpsH1 system associated)
MTPLIVHVVHGFSVGGLENGLVNLVNRMPANRWRHAIVSLTRVSSRFAARIERSDVAFIELGKGPGHLVRDYPRLYRLFRKLRPTVVHTRNLAALEAAVPAWAANVPVRIHGEHGWNSQDLGGERRRYQYVRRAYRPFVHRYVALSRDLQAYLEGGVGIPRARISQLYNGVDTERFRPADARRPIAGCPFGPVDWVLGWVGRMDAVKDLPGLLAGFSRALRAGPAAKRMKLALIGDGPMRAEIQPLLEREPLRGRVWLAGERDDVRDVMQGFDCFVLSSRAEGISNTILEAMATRLPIVATRVGGNGELLESGMTGTLVPAGDSQALAEALLGYFSDPASGRRHAKTARRVVESRFSLGRMVSDYCNLYEGALADAGVALPATQAPLAAP